MRLNFQVSGRAPFVLFAPLALSVLVLLPLLYFSTRQTPGRQSDKPPQPESRAKTSFLKEPKSGRRFTDADFASHIKELKKKIPGREFTIIIESPFVVIGDGTRAAVKSQAETVRWAVEKLKQDYFEKDPAEILDIWLFKNEASYRKTRARSLTTSPIRPTATIRARTRRSS